MHRDSRGYYYRSRRRGKRVTREYIGNSLLATLGAQLEAAERAQAAAEREAREAERKRLDDLDGQIAAVCAATDALRHATLEAAGYHRHKRGEWRRRRKPDER